VTTDTLAGTGGGRSARDRSAVASSQAASASPAEGSSFGGDGDRGPPLGAVGEDRRRRAPAVRARSASKAASRSSAGAVGGERVEGAGEEHRSSWAAWSVARRKAIRRSASGGGAVTAGGAMDGRDWADGRGGRGSSIVPLGAPSGPERWRPTGRSTPSSRRLLPGGIPHRSPRFGRKYRRLRFGRDQAERPLPRSGRPKRPAHDVDHLVDVLIGLTPFGGRPDAALDVVLEDHDRQRVDGGPERRGLLEDVDAVLLALDHRAMPRTWPSIRESRRMSPALSFEYEWRNWSAAASVAARPSACATHALLVVWSFVGGNSPVSRDMIPPGSIGRVWNAGRRGRRAGSRLSADGSARAHASVRERRRLRRLLVETSPPSASGSSPAATT
jgi:hypothetical protein